MRELGKYPLSILSIIYFDFAPSFNNAVVEDNPVPTINWPQIWGSNTARMLFFLRESTPGWIMKH